MRQKTRRFPINNLKKNLCPSILILVIGRLAELSAFAFPATDLLQTTHPTLTSTLRRRSLRRRPSLWAAIVSCRATPPCTTARASTPWTPSTRSPLCGTPRLLNLKSCFLSLWWVALQRWRSRRTIFGALGSLSQLTSVFVSSHRSLSPAISLQPSCSSLTCASLDGQQDLLQWWLGNRRESKGIAGSYQGVEGSLCLLSLPRTLFLRSFRSAICNPERSHWLGMPRITNGGPERARRRSLGEREDSCKHRVGSLRESRAGGNRFVKVVESRRELWEIVHIRIKS